MLRVNSSTAEIQAGRLRTEHTLGAQLGFKGQCRGSGGNTVEWEELQPRGVGLGDVDNYHRTSHNIAGKIVFIFIATPRAKNQHVIGRQCQVVSAR